MQNPLNLKEKEKEKRKKRKKKKKKEKKRKKISTKNLKITQKRNQTAKRIKKKHTYHCAMQSPLQYRV